MYKHLLIPTDGSELSERAIENGLLLAVTLGAKVTFVYAQPEFPLPKGGEGALLSPQSKGEFVRSSSMQAERFLAVALVAAQKAGVPACSETTVSDYPFQIITKIAQEKECDLIFMASHGRRGLAGLLIGSETHKVLTHSKIPVLVYR